MNHIVIPNNLDFEYIALSKEQINDYIKSLLSDKVADMLSENWNPQHIERRMRIQHQMEWLEWLHALSRISYETGNWAECIILQRTCAKMHVQMTMMRDLHQSLEKIHDD